MTDQTVNIEDIENKIVTVKDLSVIMGGIKIEDDLELPEISDETIDNIVDNDETKTGSEVLKATGLSYLWSKIKNKFNSIIDSVKRIKNSTLLTIDPTIISHTGDTIEYWINKGSIITRFGYSDTGLDYNTNLYVSGGLLQSLVIPFYQNDDGSPDNENKINVMQTLWTMNFNGETPQMFIREGTFYPSSSSNSWHIIQGETNPYGWQKVLLANSDAKITSDMLANKSVKVPNLDYYDGSSTLRTSLSSLFIVDACVLKKRAGMASLYLHIKAKQAIDAHTQVASLPSECFPMSTYCCTVYNPVTNPERTLRFGSSGRLTTVNSWTINQEAYLCATYMTVN